MAKSHTCKVVKAFVHEGKIRTPGKSITLSEAEAKPLLENGKVTLANRSEAVDKSEADKSKADKSDTADKK
jgi:hypothetical protein